MFGLNTPDIRFNPNVEAQGPGLCVSEQSEDLVILLFAEIVTEVKNESGWNHGGTHMNNPWQVEE
jgi:hypothetical protein